ncbi:MAG: tetratricopeptide repeat protein, partial [Pseudomonadota bacterium]
EAEMRSVMEAATLNNLAVRLDALGRREAALAAIEEAVEIRRSLAAARPDAFAEPFATSLWVRVDALDGAEPPGAAIASNAQAIATLTPLFRDYPGPLAPKMAGMAKEYLERCEKAGQDPDADLLAEVIAIFSTVQDQQNG